MTPRRRRRRPGVIRQTVALLRQAMTPALVIRSLKTGRQTAAGTGVATGVITALQQLLGAHPSNTQAATTGRTGVLISVLGAVLAVGWSLWENVTTAAAELVNDTPPPEGELSRPEPIEPSRTSEQEVPPSPPTSPTGRTPPTGPRPGFYGSTSPESPSS